TYSDPILRVVFLVFFYRPVHLPPLHSFPTRRSSDLSSAISPMRSRRSSPTARSSSPSARRCACSSVMSSAFCRRTSSSTSTTSRSEEHTSELQSRGHLVCRLLLEKKQEQPGPTLSTF